MKKFIIENVLYISIVPYRKRNQHHSHFPDETPPCGQGKRQLFLWRYSWTNHPPSGIIYQTERPGPKIFLFSY